VAQQTVDSAGSASLKLNAFNFLLARHRELVSCSAGSTALGPPIAVSIWIAGCSMPPSETAGTKNSLDENKTSFWGERSLCGSANSRFCGSASLKFECLQLFLARHRELVCCSANSTAFGPLRRPFRSGSQGAPCRPAKRLEQNSLDENETSFWGERSLCGSANSRFCGSASLKLNAFFFLARHRESWSAAAQVRRPLAPPSPFRSGSQGAPCPPRMRSCCSVVSRTNSTPNWDRLLLSISLTPLQIPRTEHLDLLLPRVGTFALELEST
jgi:hypothetical protein